MDRHLAKYGYAALILVLFASVSYADPLPARKVFNCAAPPSCSDFNLNFANLWNVVGDKIDATNAPALFSRVAGGDVTGSGGLRCLGCGVVIGRNSTSPISTAGTLVLDHDSARLELASGSGNIGRIDFSTTPSTAQWTLQRTAANHLDINGPAANNVIIHNPQVYQDEAVVYKTMSAYLGVVSAATAVRYVWAIPNDAVKTGTWKIRVILKADGVDAASDIDYQYDWFKTGDAEAYSGVFSWADFVSAANQYHVSEYLTIPVSAGATDKALAIQFTNGNAAVNYPQVTLEVEYQISSLGLTTDN